MTPPAQSFFGEALERSAHQRQVQMWQAAQTVRAHVAAGEQRDDLLACLGLSDVVAPAGPTSAAQR